MSPGPVRVRIMNMYGELWSGGDSLTDPITEGNPPTFSTTRPWDMLIEQMVDRHQRFAHNTGYSGGAWSSVGAVFNTIPQWVAAHLPPSGANRLVTLAYNPANSPPGSNNQYLTTHDGKPFTASSPNTIIMFAGTNDFGLNRSLTQIKDAVLAFQASMDLINCRVIYMTPPPRSLITGGMSLYSNQTLLNAARQDLRAWYSTTFGPANVIDMEALAQGDGSYVPAYSAGDGLHPSVAGQVAISQIVAEGLHLPIISSGVSVSPSPVAVGVLIPSPTYDAGGGGPVFVGQAVPVVRPITGTTGQQWPRLPEG